MNVRKLKQLSLATALIFSSSAFAIDLAENYIEHPQLVTKELLNEEGIPDLFQKTAQREELYKDLVPGHGYGLGKNPLRHQEVAEFFGYSMQNYGDWGSTKLISFVTIDEESIVHIGWFSDGYIVTHITGDKKGLQTVVWKDEIVGISYPSIREDSCTINQYSWGKVLTWPNDQEIEWYSNK